MPSDMFIAIDSIKGESQDSKHKEEIELESWSWGISQPATSHTGAGSGSGKVSVRDIMLVKHVDRASATLVKFCCSGRHFAKATLTMHKAGGARLEYARLELYDGIVSGIAYAAGRSQELVEERVTLHFASFKFQYVPQTSSGGPGPAIPAQWNIARNAES